MKKTVRWALLTLVVTIPLLGGGFALDIPGHPLNLSYDRDSGGLTLVSDEAVVLADQTGSVLTTLQLSDGEYAYSSPSGNFILIARFHLDEFPLVADIRMMDRSGGELWSKSGVSFASARVSDGGEVMTVAFLGEGPQAPAVVTLLNPEGDPVASWDFPRLGEARFSKDGNVFVFNVPQESLLAVSTTTGQEIAQLASNQVFAPSGDGSLIVSATTDQASCHFLDDGRTLFYETGVELPRYILISDDAQLVLIAGKDELAVLPAEGGSPVYCRLPQEGFSISSIDANEDFSLIAVGAHHQRELGAVWLYDGTLKLVGERFITMAKGGADTPQVALLPDGDAWVRTPQGISFLKLQ